MSFCDRHRLSPEREDTYFSQRDPDSALTIDGARSDFTLAIRPYISQGRVLSMLSSDIKVLGCFPSYLLFNERHVRGDYHGLTSP